MLSTVKQLVKAFPALNSQSWNGVNVLHTVCLQTWTLAPPPLELIRWLRFTLHSRLRASRRTIWASARASVARAPVRLLF